jgi:excisionase family DNA binding protein
MTDRVLLPLADGRWLALAPEVFRDALAAGSALMGAPASPAPVSEAEPLLDAGELAQALNLPKSCVYERARRGDFPSVRVGKHLRFRRSHVLEALRPTAKGAAVRT